jgi:small-conductance mechanosensitive channel
MDELRVIYNESWAFRIVLFVGLAILVHFLMRLVRDVSEWVAAPRKTTGAEKADYVERNRPKIATVTGLIVSTLSFAGYFLAFGFIITELGVPLKSYLATASVIGLAVGFGSQVLVQDIVMGLTMIFSGMYHVGDIVEVSGQIGRVERVGLRFTKLTNLHGQEVSIPNRTIVTVSRFRRGAIRAYADVQRPANATPEQVRDVVQNVARGMHLQYGSIILSEPRLFDWKKLEQGGWEYVRVRFHLWPGQGSLIETTFRHRVVAALKKIDPDYADWMITVIYRMV